MRPEVSELIAQGENLNELPNNEDKFSEGDRGEVRFYLNESLSQPALQDLQDKLLERGVTLTEPIKQDARIVVVRFEKRIAPLLIIAGIVVVGIVGWQLLKEAAKIPVWMWAIGAIALGVYLVRK